MAQEAELAACFVAIFLSAGCGGTVESRLRETLARQPTGSISLPPGIIEISSELRLAPGAHDLEVVGSRTILKAANNFKGRAIFFAEGARNLRFRDFSIDGNRSTFDQPAEMAPPENAFRVFYSNNGIVLDRVEGVEISQVRFSAIPSFAVIASRSSGVKIRNVLVEDSGTKKPNGRNNTTGGIVIEEGTSNFEVRDSEFRRIRGNALWTHSLYTSPRLHDGLFVSNRFEQLGRDAIQVGAASNVRVEDNAGNHIGYPPELVDFETYGTPVALDTAGNVDHSTYVHNKFEEVNGKCIDLDGFHDGSIVENTCVNRGAPASYAFGHFGIVMNNTDPNMNSQNIEIRGNIIDGVKFGGLFLMGSGHTVTGNSFIHLNTAECNENAKQFGCVYKADEPEMLESGIYLSKGVVRMEDVRGNTIRNNTISGHKMKSRCIAAGPGVKLRENTIGPNACEDLPATGRR
ncbi:MAG TPA: right-handed parallel beta-helix repeat-containing protein [Bryobacteraceae bacterium]|nr:right-handed parallel beta-helix repeat-containing protein [Bryobacteraceae bacterium]